MKNFVITTDSSSDLTSDYIIKNHVGMIPHYYNIDGTAIYGGKFHLSVKDFYAKMRAGLWAIPISCDQDVVHDIFAEYLEKGFEILHISTGAMLGDGFERVCEVADQFKEEYPDQRIYVMDSATVSSGLGMLMHKAVMMKRNGKTMDEIADWVDDNKWNFCVLFSVGNSRYLYENNKINYMAYLMSRLLGARLVCHIDRDGMVAPLALARGKRNAIGAMFRVMHKRMGSYGKRAGSICIVHGDSMTEARYLAALLSKKYPEASVLIHTIGPSVGTFTGPDVVGICYMGERR